MENYAATLAYNTSSGKSVVSLGFTDEAPGHVPSGPVYNNVSHRSAVLRTVDELVRWIDANADLAHWTLYSVVPPCGGVPELHVAPMAGATAAMRAAKRDYCAVSVWASRSPNGLFVADGE
ncbi:MAG: hypothetical protein ABL901_14205 [Hyphomicrobiaceae bacterium]